MTPSLALCVSGELVFTTMPGCTGHAQEATGFGTRSTSTRHMRQFPAISSFLHRVSRKLFRGVVCLNVLMVAISRNSDSGFFTSLYERRTGLYRDLLSIDREFDFRSPPRCRGERSGGVGAGCGPSPGSGAK